MPVPAPPSPDIVAAEETSMGSLLAALRWGVDRMLSVGYGLVYDYIFERFPAYRALRTEVVRFVERSVPADTERRDVRVLDIGCGAGNFSMVLAEAGFSVVGLDAYDALVTLAQEKRRAWHLPNLAFRHGDLLVENPFRADQFDVVVNVHFLYAHPAPAQVLRQAAAVLKAGGHGVFVNLTRRVPVWPTLHRVVAERGLLAGLRSLVWVAPNAIFERVRRPAGPHYWDETEFAAQLANAGFEVLEMRRTFFDGASILAWVAKPRHG